MDLPLSPYRVLDLANESGHLCGRLLGDLGADVLKVEPPGGDPSRMHGPFAGDQPGPERSLSWAAYNCNKRSITLDITKPRGRDLFLRLAKTAHFVVETGAPGYLDSMGLGYEALRAANPAIVVTSITPFGQSGPYREWKADDIVASAMGGLMHMCGAEDREPLKLGGEQAYMLAGSQAAAGAMLAHYHRLMTGEGSYVDVSIREAVVNALPDTQLFWFVSKELEHRGERHQYGGRMTRGAFPAKDGYIASHLFWGVGPGTRMRGLARWMEDSGVPNTIGKTDFTQVTGFNTSQEQVDAWEEELSGFFSRYTKAEIYREALKRRAFLFPLSSPKDLASSEQLASRGFFESVEHPVLGRVTYPGSALRFAPGPTIRRGPPAIGQHNAEVYGELGLAQDDLAALREAGVV